MKAIIWTSYGSPDVLQFKEIDKPTPKNNELLIKVHASTVTAGDVRLRGFKVPFGFWLPTRLAFGVFKPRNKVPGIDISGEVESVGSGVTLFEKGDLVFGPTGMKLGANAEYICLSENSVLVNKPYNTTHEQAAAVIFGGLTAIHFLKDKAKIQQGQKLLINGASGAVGTASVQLAKYYGAEVTGVCSSSNTDLIRSLGADDVINYNKENFTERNKKYDVILDAVGNLSLTKCRNVLNNGGKLILVNTDLWGNLSSLIRNDLICGVAAESKENLNFLKELVEANKFIAVIDKTYPLAQTIEAHRYVDLGHKRGNVVISMPDI